MFAYKIKPPVHNKKIGSEQNILRTQNVTLYVEILFRNAKI